MTDKKLIDFNLERALAGDPVVTRDGRKVLEIKFFESIETVVTLIEGEKTFVTHKKNGDYCSPEHDRDLFMAPKVKTYWVAIYKVDNLLVSSPPCLTEKEALDAPMCFHSPGNFKIIETISFEIESE